MDEWTIAMTEELKWIEEEEIWNSKRLLDTLRQKHGELDET